MAILTTTLTFPCQITSRWSRRIVKFAHRDTDANAPQHHQPFSNPKISTHQPHIRYPRAGNTWSITTSNQLKHIHFNPYDSCKHMMNNIHISEEENNDSKIAKLVKSIRRVIAKFNEEESSSFEDLIMVDALQRLAIDYHFKDEIHLILTRRYLQLTTDNNNILLAHHHNLFEVSLFFRILRQNGFYVSPDIFMKFKGNDNRFDDEKWKDDVRGLMALYEASHLGTYEETILDEAQDFSRLLLLKFLDDINDDQYIAAGGMVRDTLENPCHKTLPALNNLNNSIIKYYFNGTVLQELAQLDFHKQQTLHQRELYQISRWWREVGLGHELSLARDQPLKWYLWAMAALTTPDLSKQRIHLTKTISLIYIIDDLFDLYGTIDDLTILTHAINRWDIRAIEELPSYMKSSFKAVYDVTNDIANKVYEQHGFNPISFLSKSWARLCDSFLVEARWFSSGHIPKANEYLENGMVTSGVDVLLVHIFFLVGNVTNEEQADLINDNHHIISSVAKILRLWDDLGSAQDENQEGHDGSYMLCFLNEHEGCSVKIAREHVRNLISDTWKRLNKDCLLQPNNKTLISEEFIKAAGNIARMVPLMYNYGEDKSLPMLDSYAKAMLYDSF